MRLVCTSNEALSFDPTAYDKPTHHHLSFAADTSGHESGVSPSPSASLSLVETAENAAAYSTGAVYELELNPVPVPGTAEGAKAEKAAREKAAQERAEDKGARELEDVELPDGTHAGMTEDQHAEYLRTGEVPEGVEPVTPDYTPGADTPSQSSSRRRGGSSTSH